eukprot:sb/3467898/
MGRLYIPGWCHYYHPELGSLSGIGKSEYVNMPDSFPELSDEDNTSRGSGGGEEEVEEEETAGETGDNMSAAGENGKDQETEEEKTEGERTEGEEEEFESVPLGDEDDKGSRKNQTSILLLSGAINENTTCGALVRAEDKFVSFYLIKRVGVAVPSLPTPFKIKIWRYRSIKTGRGRQTELWSVWRHTPFDALRSGRRRQTGSVMVNQSFIYWIVLFRGISFTAAPDLTLKWGLPESLQYFYCYSCSCRGSGAGELRFDGELRSDNICAHIDINNSLRLT